MNTDDLSLVQALMNSDRQSKNSLERNVEKAIEIKQMMRKLFDDPAFKHFITELQQIVDIKLQDLIRTRPGLDGAVQNTHSIGEIAGIKFAVNFPLALIEAMDDAIKLNRFALEQGIFEEESEDQVDE